MTTKERNGRGRVRWEDGVVDESTTCVADMNGKGFSDGETKCCRVLMVGVGEE